MKHFKFGQTITDSEVVKIDLYRHGKFAVTGVASFDDYRCDYLETFCGAVRNARDTYRAKRNLERNRARHNAELVDAALETERRIVAADPWAAWRGQS